MALGGAIVQTKISAGQQKLETHSENVSGLKNSTKLERSSWIINDWAFLNGNANPFSKEPWDSLNFKPLAVLTSKW